MLALGIILCYLTGLSVLLLISRKYNWAELIGFSFLIGIFIQTLFMFLFDIVGLKITSTTLIGANVVTIAACLAFNYKNISEALTHLKGLRVNVSSINPVAVFFFCIIAYLFYAITVKNLFWPPTEHDTIGSFDKLGRLIAYEGKLRISLYDYNLQGAAGVYPPLFHGAFAYAYAFGAVMPKIITTLFFLSLLTTFYALTAIYVGSTAASFFTLLVMLTPELFSHAALSLGNMPTAAYVGAGALATITWLDKNDRKYYWLGALAMAGVIWIRSDTVVFTAAALLLVGLRFLRDKNFKDALLYGAIAVLPFVLWMAYMKLKLNTGTAGRFNLAIGYNAERFDLVWGYVNAYLFGGTKGNVDGGQLYGVTFVLFFTMLLATIGWIYKAGWKSVLQATHNILLFFFASLIAYTLLFYFIDEQAQQSPLYSLMESSFKRGMFCFVPLAYFFVATNPVSATFFAWLEKWRTS